MSSQTTKSVHVTPVAYTRGMGWQPAYTPPPSASRRIPFGLVAVLLVLLLLLGSVYAGWRVASEGAPTRQAAPAVTPAVLTQSQGVPTPAAEAAAPVPVVLDSTTLVEPAVMSQAPRGQATLAAGSARGGPAVTCFRNVICPEGSQTK